MRTIIFFFASIALASCGGGAVLTINPEAAQGITGGTAPVETAAEQTSRALNIANRTDSLLFSTIHFESTDPRYRNFVADARCYSTYCKIWFPAFNESYIITADSLSASAFSGSRRAQPVLTESGITLVERAWYGTVTSGSADLRSQGNSLVGTQRHSAFGSATEVVSNRNASLELRYSVAFGDLTRRAPAISGVWHGQMTGIMQNANVFLQGDARLTYSISGTGGELSADFTDIKNLSQNTAHQYSSVRFRDVYVSSSGTYSQGYQGSHIQGAFYGSGGVETAGTFERYGMLGAFGARR